MNRPLWFQLIERWVPERMGTTGITLPFLVGALAQKRGRATASLEELGDCVDEIVRAPVPGFTVEIRQCHNVNFVVLSVSKTDQALPFNGCYLTGPDDSPALGFSQDAQSKFGGLGSSDPNVCRIRLIEISAPHCATGKFSRLRNEENGTFEFDSFSDEEITYIERQSKACAEKI